MIKKPPTPRQSARVKAAKFANFIYILTKQPYSTAQLEFKTGMSRSTVQTHVYALREQGLAYIHHYGPDHLGRVHVPMWKFCTKRTKDAARPFAKSSGERTKIARKRLKAQEELLQSIPKSVFHLGDLHAERTTLV